MEAAVVARGVTYRFPDLGYGSSTEAEWLALIAALRVAHDLGADHFVLLGDSATVVNQANGMWKCRDKVLQRHSDRFEALGGVRPMQIRKIARAQNLAGIALARA
jgi:ribonuclease HI